MSQDCLPFSLQLLRKDNRFRKPLRRGFTLCISAFQECTKHDRNVKLKMLPKVNTNK